MGWLGVLMGKNCPKLSDDLTDTARADDRTLDGLSGFVEVRLGSVYPAEAGLTVGENARNRLIDLVGNRCGELRSEEHTSELQSLMRNSYAVFCLKKKKHKTE